MSIGAASGRAILVVLAVLVVVGGLTVFLAGQGGRTSRVPEPSTSGAEGTGRDDEPFANPGIGERTPSSSEVPSASDAGDLSLRGASGGSDAARFRGTGSIRGHVEVYGDAPFPSEWTLRVEPSLTIVGKEHAVERVVEMTGGRKDFEVRDLPLGGYDVIAEAAGMNALRHPIVLETGSESPFVNIQMIPAGELDGRIVDHRGIPADALAVTLVSRNTLESWETITDDAGMYRFEGVLDGPYQLIVGTKDAPIQKGEATIRMRSPRMSLPDVELPRLAKLEIVVADASDERLLPDVTVSASGSNGGAFRGTTDAYGSVTLRYLPPGRWNTSLRLEGYRTRRDAFDLGELDDEQLVLTLIPE